MKIKDQKVILVTGGGRGIGASIVDKFLRNDFFVYSVGTNRDKVHELNNSIKNKNLVHLHADFLENNGVQTFISQLPKLKPIDICINNAGINRIKLLPNIEEEDFDDVFQVNVKAPYLISQYISKGMKERKFGRIVNISSIWGEITKAGRSVYSASKSSILGFTRTMGVELAKDNVLVNAVSPGFTLTDLTKNSLSSEEIKDLEKQIPINKMAQPVDIAELIFFLASEKNKYIVGQNIIIDGGFSIV